jgi:hypothetical protein
VGRIGSVVCPIRHHLLAVLELFASATVIGYAVRSHTAKYRTVGHNDFAWR